jgi:hypothetical protein
MTHRTNKLVTRIGISAGAGILVLIGTPLAASAASDFPPGPTSPAATSDLPPGPNVDPGGGGEGLAASDFPPGPYSPAATADYPPGPYLV